MIVAELSGNFFSWRDFFCKAVANAALLVFYNRPFGIANAHGKGPRGWESNPDLTLLLISFLLRVLKVFSLFSFIGSWTFFIGGLLSSLSVLKCA